MTLIQAEYRKRLLDPKIDRLLRSFGAVEIMGAKYCGKTWSAMAHSNSIVSMDDPASLEIASLDVGIALRGEAPRAIDEWQRAPQIWDAVRREVDAKGGKGLFILTGSSTIDMSKVSHSGAGRISRLKMRTLSLLERGISSGAVSLGALFDGRFDPAAAEPDVERLADAICAGGWPASIGLESDLVSELPSQYLDATFDISATQASLDPRIARQVCRSYARNVGKSVTYKTLYRDVFERDEGAGVGSNEARNILRRYVSFLMGQYMLEELEGWEAPIKSRSRLRVRPKMTFADPSLPASLLGMSGRRLLGDMQMFGNLFEELAIHDLRVYASAMESRLSPRLFYYSDADGLEVDVVIELSDGRWGAIEVKLNGAKAHEAERSLLRLRRKVSSNPMAHNPDPSFLAVVTGNSPAAYRLESGVLVIPLICLGA